MPTSDVNPLIDLPKSFFVVLVPKRPGTISEAVDVRLTFDGEDVTAHVRHLTVFREPGRTFAVWELTDRPGFDGPFCTPASSL